MNKIIGLLGVFGMSFLLVALTFIIQGRIGINLADEGYLWYGSIHTYLGEVPLLDFQSYDPGRYYWIAIWFNIFNSTSILTLRVATMLFLSIGLTCALLAVRKVNNSWSILVVVGTLLILWVFPRHKMFDISISMVAVYMMVVLLENPTRKRFLISGIIIGLAAFVGSNHGLYLLIAFTIASLFIFIKVNAESKVKKIFMMGLGIVIGYSPRLIMFIIIPDSFKNFIETIIWLFRLGNTNLPLPIPWPWRIDFTHSLLESVYALIIGCTFISIVIFPICWIIKNFLLKKVNIYIAAASFVTLPYIHVAYSRADTGHLSQAIAPFLLAICFWSLEYFKDRRSKLIIFISILLACSILSIGRNQPISQMLMAKNNEYVKYSISDDSLLIDSFSAHFIEIISQVKNEYLEPNETMFIAPHSPTLYSILDLHSPLWDIYLLFPETKERQIEQIEELKRKNTTLIFLGDVALDGREELRFQNTHSFLWEYIIQNYEEISLEGLPANYKVLHIINRSIEN